MKRLFTMKERAKMKSLRQSAESSKQAIQQLETSIKNKKELAKTHKQNKKFQRLVKEHEKEARTKKTEHEKQMQKHQKKIGLLEKSIHAKHVNSEKIIPVVILTAILLFFGIIIFTDNLGFTGLIIDETLDVYTISIQENYTENSEYTFTPEGPIHSLTAKGSITGYENGTVKLYLTDGATSYLIYNSEERGITSITGFAIEDSGASNDAGESGGASGTSQSTGGESSSSSSDGGSSSNSGGESSGGSESSDSSSESSDSGSSSESSSSEESSSSSESSSSQSSSSESSSSDSDSDSGSESGTETNADTSEENSASESETETQTEPAAQEEQTEEPDQSAEPKEEPEESGTTETEEPATIEEPSEEEQIPETPEEPEEITEEPEINETSPEINITEPEINNTNINETEATNETEINETETNETETETEQIEEPEEIEPPVEDIGDIAEIEINIKKFKDACVETCLLPDLEIKEYTIIIEVDGAYLDLESISYTVLSIENATNNVTTNVTSNQTTNISTNITTNITINVTQNITQNATQNITLNITENATANITVNITENMSINISINETLNETNISVINISNTTNITLVNITNESLLNLTNISLNLTENLTINISINLTANFSLVANISNIIDSNLTKIEINKPVIFQKKLVFAEPTNNITVSVPEEASNFTVIEMTVAEEPEEPVKPKKNKTKPKQVQDTLLEEIQQISGNETVEPENITEIDEPVEDIEEIIEIEESEEVIIEIEKIEEIGEVKTDKEKEKKDAVSGLGSITGEVILDEENMAEDRTNLWDLIKRFFEWLGEDSITGRVVENVSVNKINKTEEEGEGQNNVNLRILTEKPVNDLTLQYMLPGPTAIENKTDEYTKTITVSSPYHYQNVQAYTQIPEAPPESVTLYWFNESLNITGNTTDNKTTKVDVTNNPEYSVVFRDTNNDNMTDLVEWNIPHLSKQKFGISITILNVQSYPSLHGNWTVRFNTTGTSDLSIAAWNGTTWHYNWTSGYDLEFQKLTCGNESVNYAWNNGTIYVPDYSCSQTGFETSSPHTMGKHTIRFKYGKQVAYAYNTVTFDVVGEYTNTSYPYALNGTYDVAVSGNYAYVLGKNVDNLVVINVTDPTNPTPVGSYNNANIDDPRWITIVGDLAYISAYGYDALTIINISDPTNPTYVGMFRDGAGPDSVDGIQEVVVSGEFAYVASYQDDNFVILNISDPTSITYVGNITSSTLPNSLNGAYGVDIEGDLAFVTSNIDDSLTIINISDPTDLTFVGDFNQTDGATTIEQIWGVDVVGDLAYIATQEGRSFVIVNVTDPTEPTEVTSFINSCQGEFCLAGANNVYVLGDYAYVSASWGDAFNVFNITGASISNFGARSDLVPPGSTDGVLGFDIQDGLAYTAVSTDNYMVILNVSMVPVPQTDPCDPGGSSWSVTTDTECEGDDIDATSLTISNNAVLTLTNSNLTVDAITIDSGSELRIANSKGTVWQNGDLDISGTYTLSNSTLRMNCSSNGDYTINVLSGGTMNVGNQSNITNGATAAAHYKFIIHSGSTATLQDSNISECGYSGGSLTNQGLFIEAENVILNNITIDGTDSLYGIIINNTRLVKIENSTIENVGGAGTATTDYGLYLNSAHNCTIKNNTIQTLGGADVWEFACGIYLVGSDNNTLENNSIIDIGSTSLPLSYGAKIESSDFNTFTRNILSNIHTDQGGYGLWLATTQNNTIENNTIRHVGTGAGCYQLYLQSSNHTIVRNNYLYNTTGYGVYLTGANNATFHNNTIINSSTGAITVGGTSDNNLFNKTTIENLGGGDYGIQLGLTSENNVFKNLSLNTDNWAINPMTINTTFIDSDITSVNDQDIEFSSIRDAELTFINTTFNASNVVMYDNKDQEFTVKWYFKVNVTDGGTPVETANVTVWNVSGDKQFSENTSATGLTSRYNLTQLWKNATVNITSNNHTINVTKAGYTDYTQTYNLTESTVLNIDLNLVPTLISITDDVSTLAAGDNVTFTGSWTDPDDNARILIANNSDFTSCTYNDDSGCLCHSGIYTAGAGTCNYTTTPTDGTITWYGKVCDDTESCSESTSDSFTVDSCLVPTTGDWSIVTSCNITSTTEYMARDKDILITSDGSLTINNATLIFNMSGDGNSLLNVSGGILNIGNQSNITSLDSYKYNFEVYNASTLTIKDSSISDVYEVGKYSIPPFYGYVGIEINTTNVLINNTNMTNIYAVTLYGNSGTYSNNRIYDSTAGFQTYNAESNNIINNYVDVTENAILTVGSTTNNNFTNNNLTSSNAAAVYMTAGSETNKFEGNRITSSGNRKTFWLDSNANSNIIYNNTIYGATTGYGIYSKGTSNNISFNTIYTCKEGIHLDSSDSNTIYNNTINITGREYGFYLNDADSNTIYNNTVFSKITGFEGLCPGIRIGAYLTSSSDSNTFTNENYTVAGNAIFITDSTSNEIHNSLLKGQCDDTAETDYMGSGTGTNTLFNVTFDKTQTAISGTHKIYVKWYIDINVKDNSSSNLYNANVTLYNLSDDVVFTEMTDTSGNIAQKNITGYEENASGITHWTNYSLNITKKGYTASNTENNITSSSQINKVLYGPASKCGTYSSSETWNSKVLITCDTTYSGAATTLTIEPGTNVSFDAKYTAILTLQFSSSATVLAQGTKTNYINFTSNADAPAAGDYATALWIKSDSSTNSIIEFCKFNYGATGIIAGTVLTNPIQHNIFSNMSSRGVWDTAGIKVKNNLFKDLVKGIARGVSPDADYQYNTFENMSIAGITDAYANTEDCTIKNNIFANCTTGVYKAKTGTWTLDYNVYYGNTADVNGVTKGSNNVTITDNPFVGTGDNFWHLNQTLSPGPVDSGSQTASAAGLASYTTNVDNSTDLGTADIGYHYPLACSIPPTDDWNISTNCVFENTELNVPEDRNLNILSGGQIHLSNVTLKFNQSTDGASQLHVFDGATFNATAGTNITSADPNKEFVFPVETGTTFNMNDSYLSECGYGTTTGEMGLEINTTDATITNNNFTNNMFGLAIYSSGLTIQNNIFKNNSRGAYIEGENTILSNNNFTNNSVYSIIIAGSNNNITNNNHINLSTAAIGIQIFDSATNTIIKNIIIESATSSYGIINGTNTLIKDVNITGTFVDDIANVTNATLLNVSFNQSNVGGATTTLKVRWYLDVLVNSTHDAYLASATVTGYQTNGSQEFTDTTNATGQTKFNVTEYNQTGTSSKYYFTNYTINTSAASEDYDTDSTELNITTNTQTTITLNQNTYPTIAWEDPTPEDTDIMTHNYVYLNTTITDAESNTSAFFDWNKSLVGYWSFDEYNSTGIYDNSTYDNFADHNSTDGTNLIDAKMGTGLSLDGSGEHLEIENADELNITGDMTISAWIKVNDFSSSRTIISKGDSSGFDRYVLQTNTDGKVVFANANDGTSWGAGLTSDMALETNTWYHIAATVNSSNASLYINGTVNDTSASPEYASASNYEVWIGRRETSGQSFNGTIDEVMIFNRALSADEILAIYNNTANRLKHNFTGLGEGTFNYSAYAIDTDGNLNITTLRTVQIDTSKPILTLQKNATNVTLNSGKISINWTSLDTEGIDTVIFNVTFPNGTLLYSSASESGEINLSSPDNLTVNGTYSVNLWANDTSTNTNSTSTTFIVNSAPTIDYVNLTPTEVTTSDDLYVNATCSDTDVGETLIAHYNIFKAASAGEAFVNQTGQAGSMVVNNGENTLIKTIISALTTRDQVWMASVKCYDTKTFSAWSNSSNVTIDNTAPTAVTLLTPTQNNLTIHERTPNFNWTAATDDDSGDTITYEINITSTSGCGGDRNVTGITDSNYTPSVELCTADEMGGDQLYYWKVRSYDGTNYSAWSDIWNFSIEPWVVINLTDITISFGEMTLGQIDDTTDNDPSPFILRNNGNVEADLVNVSSATAMWQSSLGALGTRYFQIKAGNTTTEAGAFNWSASETDWLNITQNNQSIIHNLNYSDSKDEAELEIKLEVPGDEPSGSKNGYITFYWEQTP